MKAKISFAVGAVLLLLLTATAAIGATVAVTQISPPFEATNPSVARTSDGVQFGPYANGGTAGGSLCYSGLNGQRFDSITALSYMARYNTTNNTTVGVPYLRIFLNNDANDVIFSPNTQPAPQSVDENVDNSYNVVAGTVRYDDDPGNGPDSPYATVRTDHGAELISGICVTTGFSAGDDLSAMLTHLGVNATDFCFNCNPPPPPGPAGGTGAVGAQGPPGPAAQIVAPPVVPATSKCTGDVLRTLHAPAIAGQTFLSTRATLRGHRLTVRGRSITVDLRGQPAGNYNVHLTSSYRRGNGTSHTVRTTRNLSVKCG